jgi:DNA-binding MarR family transcriptional regulator
MSPRWLDQEEAATWRAFLRMRRALERGLDRQLLAESGLSAADYQVLVPLSEAPSQELRARDLGRDADWERSRLSHQLRRMESRGLIERRECPTDARGTIIVLTASGAAAIKEAAPAHVDWVRRNFIDLLDREELACLHGVSERILDNLAASSCSPCDEAGDCEEEENSGELCRTDTDTLD